MHSKARFKEAINLERKKEVTKYFIDLNQIKKELENEKEKERVKEKFFISSFIKQREI